jgi:hypothetical protein
MAECIYCGAHAESGEHWMPRTPTVLDEGALGGILSPASQSLAQAADRLQDFL